MATPNLPQQTSRSKQPKKSATGDSMMNLKKLRHMDRDDILNLLGLETKPSTTGWLTGVLGTFGVGMLVGAGIGMVLAPKTGRDLRSDLRERLRSAPEALSELVQGHHHGCCHQSAAVTKTETV